MRPAGRRPRAARTSHASGLCRCASRPAGQQSRRTLSERDAAPRRLARRRRRHPGTCLRHEGAAGAERHALRHGATQVHASGQHHSATISASGAKTPPPPAVACQASPRPPRSGRSPRPTGAWSGLQWPRRLVHCVPSHLPYGREADHGGDDARVRHAGAAPSSRAARPRRGVLGSSRRPSPAVATSGSAVPAAIDCPSCRALDRRHEAALARRAAHPAVAVRRSDLGASASKFGARPGLPARAGTVPSAARLRRPGRSLGRDRWGRGWVR